MRSKSSKKQTKISKKRSDPVSKKLKMTARRSKVLSKRTFIMTVIFGFLLSLAIIYYFSLQRPIQSKSDLPEGNDVVDSKQEQINQLDSNAVVDLKQEQINQLDSNAVVDLKQEQISQSDNQVDEPIRLSIPIIGVDTDIESVGLEDGAVGAPKVPSSAAWYNLSVMPGDLGSSVITGHYGSWIDGRISVFDNLYKLKKGDKIYVTGDNGQVVTFVVRELKSYDRNAKVTEIFYSTDGKSHLNLITCEGVWDKMISQYSKRLVVFADKENE